jgi:putative ABC transport system permease protein
VSLWRHVSRGLRALFHRAAADQDVADEVEYYFEQTTEAWRARGLTLEAARRAARLEFGNITVVREEVRGYGWENVIGTLLADLRYGARRLRRSPGFAATSALTLALGIGASTAIFSAVNPILFEPLPYPEASRIAMIWDYGVGGSRLDGTYGTYRELTDRSRSFDAIAVMKPWQPTMTGPAEPERLDGQRVSAAYFRVLGVHPVLGRDLDASDDRLNGPMTVVLSDKLWQRRFGGDPSIVGRQIRLDDNGYTVIGVMPKGFENVLAPSAELWTALQYDMSSPRAWGHHVRLAGRLRPGIGLDQAKRDIDAIASAPVPEFPRPVWAGLKRGFIVDSLQDEVTRGVKPALLAVLGAVLLVLAIASVNVTNLLLARGAQRRGEFAVRAALGAGRTRMIRQVLTESLLLAALGGALGIVVAEFGVRTLLALRPAGLPRATAIGINAPVFAFALAMTTLVGVAFGLVPALQAIRNDPHQSLQYGSRRTAGGHGRIRNALVVVEVALALVLLVSSGLLLRSLQRLFSVEAGFASTGLVTLQVQTAGHRFDDDRATAQFFSEVLEHVRGVPGVVSAGLTSQLPLSGDFELYGVQFDPQPSDDPGEIRGSFRYSVSPDYLETMGIPLRQGRLLNDRDRAGMPRVALISESLARRRLPGLDPIGKRLRIGPQDGPLYTVVGVVGDVKQMSLALNEPDAVYTTASQWQFADPAMSLVVRAHGDATQLVPAIRQAVWLVDKDQPIVRVATMDALVAASGAERRFALTLFETFGIVALVLAATGIYGVLSGSVTERMREIGVRAALGATRGNILALVVRQGMTLTGLGTVLGLAWAAVATRALVTLLFTVSHLDPITYLGVIALLACASVLACGLPAWRAAQVDPASTLRAE